MKLSNELDRPGVVRYLRTRLCLSTESAIRKPCNYIGDIRAANCESGHVCVVPPAFDAAATQRGSVSSAVMDIDELVGFNMSNVQNAVMMSTSAADDGGFIAIADVTSAAERAGVGDQYRLLGGVAVMLHVQRLGLALPVRQTQDADYGVPPHVLRSGRLVKEIERLGYKRTFGNTWEKVIDETRTASTDLLVPAYTSKARDTKRVGDVITTEVPGLSLALLRPPVELDARFVLADRSAIETHLLLPDAAAMLYLKMGARLVRDQERDSTDLWRCLEIASADGVTQADLVKDPVIGDLGTALYRELGRDGISIPAITKDLNLETAGRLVTRIQALLLRVTGS